MVCTYTHSHAGDEINAWHLRLCIMLPDLFQVFDGVNGCSRFYSNFFVLDGKVLRERRRKGALRDQLLPFSR